MYMYYCVTFMFTLTPLSTYALSPLQLSLLCWLFFAEVIDDGVVPFTNPVWSYCCFEADRLVQHVVCVCVCVCVRACVRACVCVADFIQLPSALVCRSCTRGLQRNGAIGLVVLQTAEILGLIICFAIHFLCVTIE